MVYKYAAWLSFWITYLTYESGHGESIRQIVNETDEDAQEHGNHCESHVGEQVGADQRDWRGGRRSVIIHQQQQ